MKRSIIGLLSVAVLAVGGLCVLHPQSMAFGTPEETSEEVLDRTETLQMAREYLKGAFRDAGYSYRDAQSLGVRAMDRMLKRKVEPYETLDPIDAPSILDPDSDPILLIADHLETRGKTRQDAMNWAIRFCSSPTIWKPGEKPAKTP